MKMVALAALAEEAGRVALVSPLLTTLYTTAVLRAAEGEAATAALQRVAGGAAAALAVTNADGSWAPGDSDVSATAAGRAVELNGTASFVQDARKVAWFVVSASGPAGVGLFAVDADAPGVTIQPDHIVDLTRDQARVSFRRTAVSAERVIAAPGHGADVLARALPTLLTVTAADMCGAAEWQLQTSTAYAQMRTQFEHPIGFFQAVKHPLVNMMLAIDQARSLVYNAACALDTDPEDAERAPAGQVERPDMKPPSVPGVPVQLHGGIGFHLGV
jgi:alkylation response protein AidB-like acyl-CoA dehydrogenase